MGAGGSKPVEKSASSKHVFRRFDLPNWRSLPESPSMLVRFIETPVQFSQNLVESLQSSSETDSSRAQTIELHIQTRVAEELQRIQARESQTLADLEQRLADATSSSKTTDHSLLSLDAPRVPLSSLEATSQLADQNIPKRDINSQQVAQKIEELRQKLAERRKIKEVDAGVEKAREGVVSCLRANQKRPLDCWEEVNTFKMEVARLERDWVKKVIN
ncbi:hypothetical protein LOZ58_000590 [Ophidiomyces ophidiicola]|nr:hypothetical protein LOZ58_000590 [Ophidiomyces ophidiicola]